jgi:hypothetical protein
MRSRTPGGCAPTALTIIGPGPAASNPDALPVTADEEQRRLGPVLEQLAADGIPVSVDSSQPETQRFVISRGTAYLKDVQGFSRPQPVPRPGRADPSYLPDLTAYLDDLVRTRERLTAALAASDLEPGKTAGGIDWWAAADAMPSAEEITRLRALITRITASMDDLPAAERAALDEAVTLARRHRTVMLGMPRLPAPGPATSPRGKPRPGAARMTTSASPTARSRTAAMERDSWIARARVPLCRNRRSRAPPIGDPDSIDCSSCKDRVCVESRAKCSQIFCRLNSITDHHSVSRGARRRTTTVITSQPGAVLNSEREIGAPAAWPAGNYVFLRSRGAVRDTARRRA